jgi:hypothetical protein
VLGARVWRWPVPSTISRKRGAELWDEENVAASTSL